MKLLLKTFLSLLLLSSVSFAAKALTEENITKVLDNVKIAKEHKNIKVMKNYFLARTSVSLTDQNIETSDTTRLTFDQYKRHLSKKWKNVQSNLIEIKERSFSIDPNGKSALVKTTLEQTIEVNGVKTAMTIYETTGLKLIRGKVYINYYSVRNMLNTAMRVN
jgi:hypothetical protein